MAEFRGRVLESKAWYLPIFNGGQNKWGIESGCDITNHGRGERAQAMQ